MTLIELSDHRNVKHFKRAEIDLRDVIRRIDDTYLQQEDANKDILKVRESLNSVDLSDVEKQHHAKIEHVLSEALDSSGNRQEVKELLEEALLELGYVVSCAKLDNK